MKRLDDSVSMDPVVCSRRGDMRRISARVVRNLRWCLVLVLLPILAASCLGSLPLSGAQAPGSGPATEIRELLGASGDRVFLLTVEGSHLQAVAVNTMAGGILQLIPLPDGTEWSSVAYDQERNEMWYAASQTVSSIDIGTGVVSKRLQVTFPVNRILFFAGSIVITDGTCHYVLIGRSDNRVQRSYDCGGRRGYIIASENLACFSREDDSRVEILDPDDGHSWSASLDHEKSIIPVTLDSRLQGSVVLTLGEPDGHTWAVEEGTGKILWKANVGAIRRSVMIGQSLFVLGLFDDVTLVCLSASDGKEQWRSSFTPASNPVPYLGNILVARDVKALYCLDPASGQEVWKSDLPFSSLQTRDDDSYLYASNEYVVILGMRNWAIVDLSAQKARLWSGWPAGQSFLGRVIRSDDTVIVLVEEIRGAKTILQTLVAFSLATGEKIWELPADKLGQ